jgi:hypothetical protein
VTAQKPSAVAAAAVILPYKVVATQTVAISLASINGNGIQASVAYPAGNTPGSYNNNVFLWLTNTDPPTMVPWFDPIYSSTAMQDGNPSPFVTGPNNTLPTAPYVLGYSVGPALTTPPTGQTAYPNVCASVMIPSSWKLSDCISFVPSIGISGLTTFGGTFTYSLPDGIIPANGAWIGVWMNASPPYTPGVPPQGFAQIKNPNSHGSAPVSFPGGLSPMVYTAGLFTSGYSATAKNLVTTALAATVTFLVQQPSE